MPMDRSLYPPNWNDIALSVKEVAGWTCQECQRPCRKPDQEWADFVLELLNGGGSDGWYAQTCEAVDEGVLEKPGRFVLTVAHLNHRPEDCRPENLRALCSGCHLRYDGKDMALKKRLKRERNGQLRIAGT